MNYGNRFIAVSGPLLFSAHPAVAYAQAIGVACTGCVNNTDMAPDTITSDRVKNGAITFADKKPESIGGGQIAIECQSNILSF